MSEPAGFPPEPWRLDARAWAAAWLVPRRSLPAFDPPVGWRPLSLAGRLALGVVWAEYAGDLTYRELAAGVLVRRGLRLAVTLPWIWVDSPASQAGGRALWAIPKQLEKLQTMPGRIRAPVAMSAAVEAGQRLPGRWRLRLRIAQPPDVITPAVVRGRLRLARGRWHGQGPLAGLPSKPLFALRIEAAEVVFGKLR